MGRDITRLQKNPQSPLKGTAVRTEPFEHLFQHIKQTDPMLYEALKRMSRYSVELDNKIETNSVVEPKFDKATFGILKPLTVGNALTNYYICRKAGKFIDVAIKNKIAPDASISGTTTILDIQLSTDDGATWKTLFSTSAKITIPAGSTATLVIPKDKFAIPAISVGNLLEINCVQIASPEPGLDYEVVLRWE